MINFVFDGFILQLLKGTWITIQIALCSLLLGLLLGILGASGESASLRGIRWFCTSIISILRGVPELLILFFVYFGSTLVLAWATHHYVNVSPFLAGVIALALVFGAYSSQTIRGAFLAIPVGQIEAAQVLGLTSWQILRFIKLPQAWRHALPGLGNLWLVLLKDTALVSLIGLADLMNSSQLAANTTHKPFIFYLAAAFLYLLMTSLSQYFLNGFAASKGPTTLQMQKQNGVR